jgi:hypothetical protein
MLTGFRLRQRIAAGSGVARMARAAAALLAAEFNAEGF